MIKIAVVTGCASFLGTTFTAKLLEEGWYVYGIDKLTYVANDNIVEELQNNYSKFRLIVEDICEIKWLPECDVIFNFAAESDVDNGNKNCKNFIRSNIDGVRNLLEIVNSRIVTKANKPLFFQISTDEVYGDLISGVFDENSALNPSNPYAATKASADLLIQSWARTHGLEYIIARPSNNYGLYQYPEKLVPFFIQKLMNGEKVPVYGDGSNRRDWLHVNDHCSNFSAVVINVRFVRIV